jgi:hypothetical protein
MDLSPVLYNGFHALFMRVGVKEGRQGFPRIWYKRSVLRKILAEPSLSPFPFKLQMATIFSITKQNVSVGLLILILIGFTTRRVYSVYFGPLSKFPGPKLAAATLLYEFYYDVILKGQYNFKIKELH